MPKPMMLIVYGDTILAESGVWTRTLLHIKLYISQGRHDRHRGRWARGEDNQAVHENAGWSRSPRAQGSLLLMLGMLRRIGQHGGATTH